MFAITYGSCCRGDTVIFVCPIYTSGWTFIATGFPFLSPISVPWGRGQNHPPAKSPSTSYLHTLHRVQKWYTQRRFRVADSGARALKTLQTWTLRRLSLDLQGNVVTGCINSTLGGTSRSSSDYSLSNESHQKKDCLKLMIIVIPTI